MGRISQLYSNVFPPNTPKSCSPSSLLALWIFVQLRFNLNGICAISTSVGPWALTAGLHSLSCCRESVWRKLQNAVRWQLPLTVKEPRQYHTVIYWNSQEQLRLRRRSRDSASLSVQSGQLKFTIGLYTFSQIIFKTNKEHLGINYIKQHPVQTRYRFK